MGAPSVQARASPTVRPGALTALLGELARAPPATGWSVPAQPGERIGRFEILREIGRGGFGVVYEARDTELGRSVAFKAIHAGSTDAARELRLLAEAEAAARLAHPNIVHLYDVGRCDRGAFLILELLRGETLDERLARGPPKLREAVRVAVEIARGLAHAHEQGVVHRDLKPGNVFLCDDGQVKVLDFGLAHVFGRGGPSGGTPAYMAPEQARGDASDERTDAYALGVIVQELVTGKRPFEAGEGGGPEGGKAPEMRGAPAALAKLVTRMLAADPAERPSSGAEVQAQLEAVERSLQPRRLLWAGWALAAVALLIAAGFGLWYRPLPSGRLLAAIADTDNQTGEVELDGVSELLRIGLERSSRISLMARSRIVNILQQAERPLPRTIDEEVARWAARRADAALVLVPSVRRNGAGFDVLVKTIDLRSGETRFSAMEPAATKTWVPTALAHLVHRVRKDLREPPDEGRAGEVALSDVAPARPEALRHHAEGRRLASEGRFQESVGAHRRAIDADPAFLLPRVAVLEHVRFGNVFIQDARPHFTERDLEDNEEILRTNLHRLTGSDAAFVESYLDSKERGTAAEIVSLADRAIEAWPEDPRPYVMAASALTWERAEYVLARPYLEKAVALAALQQDRAIQYLLFLERSDEALSRARRWVETAPSGLSHHWLSEVHRQRGELEAALAASRRSARLPGGRVNYRAFMDADALDEAEALQDGALRNDVGWLMIRGRMRDARRELDRSAPRPNAYWADRWIFHEQRVGLMLTTGDPQAVIRELDAMVHIGVAYFPCYAWELAIMGDLDRAERLSTFVAGGGDNRMVCTGMVRAIARWKRGSPAAALAILDGYPLSVSDFYRGEIFSELGRDRDAVEALRRYRLRRGMNFFEKFLDGWNYPRSLYLEAAALERLGATEDARRVVARLLHLWERADPDTPMLREAKALRARLAAGAPQ